MPDFAAAFFNDTAHRGSITRLEVRQAYSEHTLVVVDLSVPTNLLRVPGGALYPEMTPVMVDWGRSSIEANRFYGYVNHPEIITNESGNPTVRYFCLGTSLVMNASTPRSWSGVTASFVVAEIARTHRLRALLHRSITKLPTFTIRSETDFASLQRLAAEAGFRLWVDGATVQFVDPNVLIRSAASVFVPVYTGVTDFSITPGTLVPRSGGVVSEKVVNGRSIATKKAFTVKSGTVLKTRPSDVQGFKPPIVSVLPGEVGTYTEAQERLTIANRLQNWITATVRLPGAPLLHPGSLVSIDGPQVPADHTGIWHIEGTRHVMNISAVGNTAHSTDVTLSRNQGQVPAFSRTSQLSGTPAVVGCVRRQTQFWESESLDIVHLD